LHYRLGSGKFGQQRLDFVGWAFLDQKFENDADGFFRSRTIYADISDQTCDQFVHYFLASPERSAGRETYCRVTGGGDKQARFERA
jgi:hypothetical protein